MKNNKGIQWKNIYYMLCYCIDELQYFKENLIKQEDVTGTHDLLAQLLVNSFELLYRNGYIKKYRSETITTSRPHGRLDIAESICTGAYAKGNLLCHIDTLDSNNKINQIIKAAFNVLILSNSKIDEKISESIMASMYKYRDMLKHVDNIEVSHQILNQKIDIPEWYKPIFAVCKMILNDWLALDESGNIRLLDLNDNERLCYIWEKFVRHLLSNILKNKYEVSKPIYRITAKKSINPDILVHKNSKNKVVVADCKWYEFTNKTNNNMYQAIAYGDTVSNKYSDKDVTSILLYASSVSTEMIDKSDRDENEGRFLVEEWQVNVNQSFDLIKMDIENIITNHLD